MPILKRKIRAPLAMQKKKAAKANNLSRDNALARMGEILAAGHGDEAMARIYFTELYTDQHSRLQSIAKRGMADNSWSFLEGSVKQAADLYVFCAAIYEHFPTYTSPLSDPAYDALARFLLKHYKRTEKEFWHWYNITAMGLKTATGADLTIRENIRWMLYIHTGQDMGKLDEPRKRSRVLQKPSKRGSQPAQGDGRGKTGKRVLKRKRRT